MTFVTLPVSAGKCLPLALDDKHYSSRNSCSYHSKVGGLSIYWVGLRNFKRFSIFFSCRKYLLRIFYSDLHSLSLSSSSSSVPGTPGDTITSIDTHNELAETIQLDTLPLPSTAHTPKSPQFTLEDPTYLHAAVSRIMFSWCFTESCMMFFLLMLQAFGIFSATWVIQTFVVGSVWHWTSTRLLNWQFSLFLILLSILVIIPFAISLFLTIGNPGLYPILPLPFDWLNVFFYRSSTAHCQNSRFS